MKSLSPCLLSQQSSAKAKYTTAEYSLQTNPLNRDPSEILQLSFLTASADGFVGQHERGRFNVFGEVLQDLPKIESKQL